MDTIEQAGIAVADSGEAKFELQSTNLWQGTPGITEVTDGGSTGTEDASDASGQSTLRYGIWYRRSGSDAICEQYSEQVKDIS